jgi:hypothetical protein
MDVSVDALTEAGIFEVLRRPMPSTELAAALTPLPAFVQHVTTVTRLPEAEILL